MNEAAKIDTLAMLKKEVAKIINADSVDANIGIGELGIDSLNIVELIVFCEQLYGSVDPERLDINEYTTLEDLDRQLRAIPQGETTA